MIPTDKTGEESSHSWNEVGGGRGVTEEDRVPPKNVTSVRVITEKKLTELGSNDRVIAVEGISAWDENKGVRRSRKEAPCSVELVNSVLRHTITNKNEKSLGDTPVLQLLQDLLEACGRVDRGDRDRRLRVVEKSGRTKEEVDSGLENVEW